MALSKIVENSIATGAVAASKLKDFTAAVDLNGVELILDADQDTSITADTDDQIDIKISGADDFRFTANTFTALAGSGIVVPDGGLTLGSTAVSSTAAELNILDDATVTTAELNLIDGGTARGTTAVADADGLLHNDGGTMRMTSAATFKTYFQEGISTAYDDLTTGDAAVNIATSAGNITIDAQGNDTDIIFKGTDGGADRTFMTIDGSAGGDLFLTGGLIDLKNDGSAVSNIKFYCESSNAHAQTLIGAPHSESADNVLTLPGTGGDARLVSTASTATLTNKTLTSPVINTGTFGTSILPTSADGTTLGSASKEFSDLFLANASQIVFGNDQDISFTHVDEVGLLLKNATTADDKPIILTLQTGETDIAANDVLGSILFQAPDEGAGTDAILIAAGIEAVSEGDFSASNNATKLSFKTAASELASEKMSLSSAGVLTVSGGVVGALTGNVTGNASGSALTVTQAAQSAITSLGTLTALTVDDVAVDGKVITMTGSSGDTFVTTVAANGATSLVTTDAAAAAAHLTITADGTVDINSAGVLTLDSGAAINIEPASGSAILLDGTISIDAGVVTGATSVTSTAFVGNLTGTVATATQNSITTMTGLVTTGALGTGSIAAGFGAIDNGTSGITTGGNLVIDVDADANDNTTDSAAGRLAIGASGDLNLFHNTNSYIVNKTGNLILHSETDDSDIVFTGEDGSSGITALTLDMSAAGQAVFGSGGIKLGGDLQMQANDVKFDDNAKLLLGDSNDLQIYHDGSHSYVYEQGTGDLYLRGTEIRIKSGGDNDDMATFIENGAATLFYSNAAKIATTNTGVTVTGAVSESAPRSGQILQRHSVNPNPGHVQRGAASWGEIDTDLRVAITPLFSDSIIEVECVFMFGGRFTSNITHFKLYDHTNSSDINLDSAGNRSGAHGSVRHVDTDINDVDMVTIKARTTASNTNARTYAFYSQNESGTGNKNYFASESNSGDLVYVKPIITVTEIRV